MRKSHSLFLVVALLAGARCSTDLLAQSPRTPAVGVIGGVATTSMVGKDAADDLERRSGVVVGLSANFATKARLQVEVDGLYATKGFRSPGRSSSFDFTAGYLDVPVLLRLSLAPNALVRPFLTGGPAFGLRIACNAELTSTTGTARISCGDFERSADLNVGKTDLSGVLGAGAEFPIGSLQGTLAARYTRGFSSVIGGDNHFRAFGVYLGLSRTRRE